MFTLKCPANPLLVRFTFAVAMLLAVCCTRAIGQPGVAESNLPDTKKIDRVFAEGTGADRPDALRNALRNAVRKALGVYVLSEDKFATATGRVEEIATFSNGYINTYKVFEVSSTAEVVTVAVYAEVRRSRVIARLDEDRVPLRPGMMEATVDATPLFAEAVSRNAQTAEAKSLLSSLLSHCPPVSDYASVSLLAKPKIEKASDNAYHCNVVCSIKYDWEKLTAYNRWVDDVLSASGIGDRYEEKWRRVRVHESTEYGNEDFFELPRRSFLSSPYRYYGNQTYGKNPLVDKLESDQGILLLLTDFQLKGRFASFEWAAHIVNKEALMSAVRGGGRYPPRAVGLRLQASVLSETNDALGSSDTIVFDEPKVDEFSKIAYTAFAVPFKVSSSGRKHNGAGRSVHEMRWGNPEVSLTKRRYLSIELGLDDISSAVDVKLQLKDR